VSAELGWRGIEATRGFVVLVTGPAAGAPVPISGEGEIPVGGAAVEAERGSFSAVHTDTLPSSEPQST